MCKTIKTFFLALVLYLTAFLVTNPQDCLNAAQTAINLCIEAVIPSLFPFFVCSGLLCSLGFSTLCSHFLSPLMRPIFNLPGAGALTLFMGILSGYPIGAATAIDLYKTGLCTKTETERMLSFCNNSGPMFIIGVVGSNCLGSEMAGWYLYISHIISALLVGVAFRFYKSTSTTDRTLPPALEQTKKTTIFSLGGVIDSSVFSILKVCGFIIFFAVFVKALPDNPFLYSLVEITGGIKLLSQSNTAFTLPFISFFLALSGLSVLFQVSAIIQPFSFSLKTYICGKMLHGALSFVLTLGLTRVFPLAQETFAANTILPLFTPVSLSFSSVVISLITVFVLICIMIPLAVKKCFD